VATVFYLHWNEEECSDHVRALEAEGHIVCCHWSTQSHAVIPEQVDAVVISLDRLPSHGRAVADGFWSAKKRQSTPILFVGGDAEKVASTREKFGKARFCTRGRLPGALAKLNAGRRS
jgi:hypothetical protein